jgi:Rrf2 family iron-sulfur cluster assembly transcriptional regulator
VESTRGPGGGYRLGKQAADISVADIIFAVDEPLDATQCSGRANCDNDSRCMTHDLWSSLNRHMVDFLDSVTLANLVAQQSTAVRPVAVPATTNRFSGSRPPVDESTTVG